MPRRTPSSHPSGRLGPALRSGLLLATFLTPAPGLRAQSPSLRPLEPDHWSYRLLETLQALEGSSVWYPWQAPAMAAVVDEDLELAAGVGGEGQVALTRWRSLFDREVGRDPAGGGWSSRGPVSAEGGYEASDALPWRELGAFAGVRGEIRATDRVTLWAEGRASETEGASLASGGAALRFDQLQIVAGRVPLGMGQGVTRLLLNGLSAFDGVWLGSARPVELPGLGFLGRVSGHVFVGPGVPTPPADSVPGGMEAWFMSTAVRIEPHPRVQISLMRTARFAGDSVESATLGRLLETFTVGAQKSDFDDTQGELAVRVRVDLLGLHPTPYLSLGFEDREALWQDPGIVSGVLLPLPLGDDLVSFRYEYAGFGKRAFWCRGCEYVFHAWYRHRAYGTYTLDGRPIGALLGGYGSSHQVELQYWSGRHPLRARAVLFREKREAAPGKEELGRNLLLDRWPGVRKGLRLEASYRPAPSVEVAAEGTLTSTGAGAENGASVTVRLLDLFGGPRR